MSRPLPPHPSLRYLRLQAKDLLKALPHGNPEACQVLRGVPRWSGRSPEQIQAAKVTLQQMQHALAVDYGFKSWQELTERVTSRGGARSLDADERERLEVWDEGSHMGDVLPLIEEGDEAAEEILSLLDLERTLEPISDDAWAIRRAQGLEPPDVTFMAEVDACIASIAAGEPVAPDLADAHRRLGRQSAIVEDYRLSLESWRAGRTPDKAKAADAKLVGEVYDALGDRDEEKDGVAAMVVGRIDPAERDLTRSMEIFERLGTWEPDDPQTLEEKLFHDMTRLDLGTWFTVHNIRAMIRNIGLKERREELHCWVGDPADIPRLQTCVAAVDDWLAGNPPAPETQDLGDPNAYKEKTWLARCLLVPLRGYAHDPRVLRLMA